MFVSTFQLHRVRRQATALFNYYDILDDYHPEHDALWCANKAAQRLGHVVTGGTVYRWHLEFSNVNGFLVDKRGSYTRSVFVEDEDIKLKAKAWMKDPVSYKHLSRDKFATWGVVLCMSKRPQKDAKVMCMFSREIDIGLYTKNRSF